VRGAAEQRERARHREALTTKAQALLIRRWWGGGHRCGIGSTRTRALCPGEVRLCREPRLLAAAPSQRVSGHDPGSRRPGSPSIC